MYAEVRRPNKGWPPDAVDLIKTIAVQGGYQLFEAKLLNSEEVVKLEIILPKSKVPEFQSWLDVRSLGQTFIVLEHH